MSQKLLKSLSTSVLDPQIRHRSANSTVHAMVARSSNCNAHQSTQVWLQLCELGSSSQFGREPFAYRFLLP